jgi:hypothetical protein
MLNTHYSIMSGHHEIIINCALSKDFKGLAGTNRDRI